MTAIKGFQEAYTATNINQTLFLTEGQFQTLINPIVLTTRSNFSDELAATFTISGTSQSAAINLICTNIGGLSLTRVGDVYTLSSVYTKNGVSINNWAYFILAMQNLQLAFTNSDILQSFSLLLNLTCGGTVLNGSIYVSVTASPDMTGIPQTKLDMPMAFVFNTLPNYGMANIQIADPQQASKTYRITLTVNDVGGSNGTLKLNDTANAVNQEWNTTVTLSGTQAYINDVMAGTNFAVKGFAIAQYDGNFADTYTISYLQEVITSSEIGVVVPYVQETGTITLGIPRTPYFNKTADFNYQEDTTTGVFALGTIVDKAGFYWPWETTSPGFNAYTLTATVQETFTGPNPLLLTYAGDPTPDQTVSFAGTYTYLNALTALNNLYVVPAADYTGPITIKVTLARGNDGVVSTIYDQNIVLTCNSTHTEFSIISGAPFVLGANVINFGSIADFATSKSYSVTMDLQTGASTSYGSLSTASYGSWNATGGAYGFGRLTLTGTKAQLNSVLSAVTYTTAGGQILQDSALLQYTQTQTTNSVAQGTKAIGLTNDIIWHIGNGIVSGQPQFVYDQDVAMSWDLAELYGNITAGSHTAKLVFSTPLSVANLGSVTGWTRETDYIWTLTDTKANLNIALAAIVFNPPAALVSNFTLDIKVYDGATLLADTSALGTTKTVYIRTLVSAAWTGSALTFDQDTAATYTNISTLNANFNAGTYTLRLRTSVATSGTITGWSVVDSTTFEKTDTKANLQTALNSLVFTPGLTFVSTFVLNIEAYRSSIKIYDSALAANPKTISIGVVYAFNPTASTLTYNQDNTTTFAFGTFSSNFSVAKTYTIRLTTVLNDVGAFTGWTKTSATTYEKTGTGSALITAMGALEFVPAILLTSNLSITVGIIRTATLVSTSAAKTIFIGSVYGISTPSSTLYYNQDSTQTYTSKFNLNTNFNNSATYTAEINITAALNAATFTGWTVVSPSLMSKTDTGANLITALNSLVMVSSLTQQDGFNLTVNIKRSSTTVITSNNVVFLASSSVYTVTPFTRGYLYGGNGNWNWGSLSSWMITNAGTITATLVINTPYITVSSVGWTVVSDQNLTITDTPANVQTALNNITVTPDYYYSGNFTTTLTVKKGSTTIATGIQNVTVSGFPEINFGTRNIGDVGFIIGADYDYTDLIGLVNIPSDGSTYKLRIESPSDQLFGNVTTPGLTWTQDGNSSVSSLAIKSVLETALTDVKLFTKTSSTLHSTSSPTIRYSIEAPAPFVTKSTLYTNARNAAAVNGGVTTTTIGKGFSATYNAGSFWFGKYYLDPATTYTMNFDTGLTGVSLTGWVVMPGNIYSFSGIPSDISAALSAVQYNVGAGAVSRSMFLRVYQSTTLLYVKGYTLNTF